MCFIFVVILFRLEKIVLCDGDIVLLLVKHAGTALYTGRLSSTGAL